MTSSLCYERFKKKKNIFCGSQGEFSKPTLKLGMWQFMNTELMKIVYYNHSHQGDHHHYNHHHHYYYYYYYYYHY